MENSKTHQERKPPISPKLTPNRSTSTLTPEKRKFPEYGHLMDSDTITLSAAKRKHSRVDIFRTTCDNGKKINLWRVPFYEATNALRQATPTERQTREFSEKFYVEHREKLETNVLNLECKLSQANSNEVFVMMAQLHVENQSVRSTLENLEKKFKDLDSKFESQKKTIEDLQSTLASQQIEIETIKDKKKNIEDLQSTVASQRNEIEDQKQATKDQKKKIHNLQSTSANQQIEIGFLQGFVYANTQFDH